MVVIFGILRCYKQYKSMNNDYDLDEYLSQEDFTQKIKDDEPIEHGEN